MIKDFLDQDSIQACRIPSVYLRGEKLCLTEGREGLLSQDLIILQKVSIILSAGLKKFESFFYFWCQADRVPQQWCEDVGMLGIYSLTGPFFLPGLHCLRSSYMYILYNV